MKADVSLSKEHKSLCIDSKNEKEATGNELLQKHLTKEELNTGKKEMVIIPVEHLNEVQLQQIQDIPGAYLLTTEQLSSDTSPICLKPQNNTSYKPNLVKNRFLVKHSTKLISIDVNQIAYFYAENRLNFIKTWNNKTYIVDKTIEEINSIINNNEFFRINRSYIISYKSIEEVHTHFNNRLKLKLNVAIQEELFVSKDRVANFKEWLGA